jgi:hypothetical protein
VIMFRKKSDSRLWNQMRRSFNWNINWIGSMHGNEGARSSLIRTYLNWVGDNGFIENIFDRGN